MVFFQVVRTENPKPGGSEKYLKILNHIILKNANEYFVNKKVERPCSAPRTSLELVFDPLDAP